MMERLFFMHSFQSNQEIFVNFFLKQLHEACKTPILFFNLIK
jgi:hypothetical protein